MKIPTKKKRANISYFPFDQAQRWVDVGHHRIRQRLIRSFSCFHHCRLAFFLSPQYLFETWIPEKKNDVSDLFGGFHHCRPTFFDDSNKSLKHEFLEKRMMDHVFLVFSLLFMTAILTWNMKPGYKNNESSLFDVFGRWVPQLFMELSHDEAWIWSITDPEVAWFWGSPVIDAWKGANFALREQIYLYRCQRKPNPWKPSCINSPRLIIGACI